MNVIFSPFCDDVGCVGYYYKCLKCGHEGKFSDSCDKCSNEWPDIDQDDWYDREMKKPVNRRAWNLIEE